MDMGKRDAQSVTMALISLDDARDALQSGRRDAAIQAMQEAHRTLEGIGHAAGVPVAQAARRLGVSVPTVRSWIARGALAAIKGSSPVEIEPESLRSVGRALDELRERGQDREWLQALVDYLDDRKARQRPALREGLEQLARGELEPA
jgi:DNA invertase Pin-like site-specific DNA recombinase